MMIAQLLVSFGKYKHRGKCTNRWFIYYLEFLSKFSNMQNIPPVFITFSHSACSKNLHQLEQSTKLRHKKTSITINVWSTFYLSRRQNSNKTLALPIFNYFLLTFTKEKWMKGWNTDREISFSTPNKTKRAI